MRTDFKIAFVVALITAGCATSVHRKSNAVPTAMNRVTVVKETSGKLSRTVEPIIVKRDSASNYSIHQMRNDDSQQRYYSSLHDARVNNDMTHLLDDMPWDSGLKSGGLEVGLIGTRVWHSFTTDFSSPSFNNIKWSLYPKISGTGGELNYYFADDRSYAVSLGGGSFHSENTTNSQEHGSFFVKERTTTDASWIHTGIRAKPSQWLYLQALIGLFAYEISTEVSTNAPVYTYEGLSGQRVFGATGVGGGLETPWDFPLHLFSGFRIWIPISDDAFYESAVGQLTGGLLYRF